MWDTTKLISAYASKYDIIRGNHSKGLSFSMTFISSTSLVSTNLLNCFFFCKFQSKKLDLGNWKKLLEEEDSLKKFQKCFRQVVNVCWITLKMAPEDWRCLIQILILKEIEPITVKLHKKSPKTDLLWLIFSIFSPNAGRYGLGKTPHLVNGNKIK